MSNGAAPRRHCLSECERAVVSKIGDLIRRRFGEDASSLAVMRQVDKHWPYLWFRVWLYGHSPSRGRVSTTRECVGATR
jgi:hypothetical protein